MSDFRPDTKGAVVDTFLGSLVQSCCGEGGMLQTNNTGVCSQCLSHTGPAPTHCMCALPAHTAQALGCSARNCPGSQVVLRGTDSVGPAFCALPRSKQLRQPGVRQVHCPRWAVRLNHLPISSRSLSFPGAPQEHHLRCAAVCLLWGADLRLRPSWQMSAVQDPRKT